MPRATFFVKEGAWSASALPLLASNTTYSSGTLTRQASGLYFLKCTASGTTNSNSFTKPLEDTDPVAIGTTQWVDVRGRGGVVANTWDIAIDSLASLTNKESTILNQGWYYGKLFDANGGRPAIVYLASGGSYPGSLLSNNTLCSQAYTPTTYFLTSNSYDAYLGFPAGIPYELQVISADETIAAPVHGTFKAGATFDIAPGTTDVTYLAGKNYLKGLVINAPSTPFHISYYIPGLGTRAIQFACVNELDQCTINLTLDPAYGTTSSLVIGGILRSGNFSTTAPTLPTAPGSSTARGEVMRTTFTLGTINMSHPSAQIAISSDTEFYGTTMNISACAGSGLFVFNTSPAWGDIEVSMVGCKVVGPVARLIAPGSTGRVVFTIDGCELPSGDADTMFWGSDPMSLGTVAVHVIGSGVAGAIDPYSHSYYTNRVKSIKTNGVYRVGNLPDENDALHSYYVATKGEGLAPLAAFDELPHLSRVVTVGDYEVRLLVAVPPDQLLHDDELFALFLGPDLGTADGVAPWSSFSSYGDGEYAASSAWCRRTSLLHPRSQHPVVAASWVGVPSGWVTQALSIVLSVPASGRIHCIPMVAKTGAQFILCPTLDLLRIA